MLKCVTAIRCVGRTHVLPFAIASSCVNLFSRIICIESFSTAVKHLATDNTWKSRQMSINEYNIEVQCPDLIKLWHHTKNSDLKPNEVSVRSAQKIWWKCSKGPDHEWLASPRNMFDLKTKTITGCPFCMNRKVSVTNSLATLFPELSAQWYQTLNGNITPSDILPGSYLPAWWKCDKGEDHIWKRVVYHRTNPRSAIEAKCPFCEGIDMKSRCLSTVHPELLAEWDSELNGDVSPDSVTKSSGRKFWWKCSEGHRWLSSVNNRGSTHNSGCPICSGRRISEETKLSNNRDLLEFLDEKQNNDVDINSFSMNCRHRLQWRCPESLFDETKKDHVWKCSVPDMINRFGSECPYCNGILHSKIKEDITMNWSMNDKYDRIDDDDEYYEENYHNKSSSKKEKKRNYQKRKSNNGRVRRRLPENIESIIDSL